MVVVSLVVILLLLVLDLTACKTMTMTMTMRKMKNNKISIIGGGMSGLSIACHLINKVGKDELNIDIYDSRPVGYAVASSVAAGLMHPLSPKGSLIWKGEKGYESTKSLLNIVKEYANGNNLYQTNELLIRPFSKKEEYEIYEKSSLKIPHWIQMIDINEITKLLGSHAVADNVIGGAIIKNSLNINCPVYLQSMWAYIKACSNANWISKDVTKEEFTSLFDSNDIVIASCSTGIQNLHDINENDKIMNKLNYVRGQNIYMKMNDDDKMHNIINGRYAVCKEIDQEKVYLCGATYEYVKEFDELFGKPNVEVAKGMLMDKLVELNKDLKNRDIVEVKSGVRLTTIKTKHGKIPFIRQHQSHDHVLFVGGFGSHGLIHHSLVAEIVADNALLGCMNDTYRELYDYNPENISVML